MAHPGEDRRLHPLRRTQVHQGTVPGQLGQGSFRHRRPQPEGLRHALRCHGRVGARVAQKQVVQWRAGRRPPLDRATGPGPLQRPVGDLCSQGPLQIRHVLDPGPQLPPADLHRGGSARPGQLGERSIDLPLG